MKHNKFKDNVLELLKKDDRIWADEDKKKLDKPKLFDLLDKLDDELINILLENKETREKFFIKLKDAYVFNLNDFRFFIDEISVYNSYTNYENKIGLKVGNQMLMERDELVLNFPFKDCVLKGGQTTEEGKDAYFEYNDKKKKYEEKESKRKEIFFNEILAKDEIDRLEDPKALVNWKRVTTKGEVEVGEIKRDEKGTIKENLIMKGNNLLALHSLKEQFKGKVKLIYIDPPYNTGGSQETFTYNNDFNHSTWLTFMKNRLELAKEFLRKDGFIAITIDHVELFYLGALADEVFGRENRVGIVTIYINPKGRQHERFFSASTEHMLVYAKNHNAGKFNNVAIDEEKKKQFNLKDEKGSYRLDKFIRARTSTLRNKKPNFWYPIYVSPDLNEITTTQKKKYYEVYPIENGTEYTWKTKKETFEERNKDGEYIAKKKDNKVKIFNKYREQQVFKNIWTDKKYFPEFQGTNLLKKIIGENKFSYPKSLYSVLDTLKIMTEDEDIIMDFFAGSGTTGHATLELNKEDGSNRQFILIEQLDKHIKVCKERIQKVMENLEKQNDLKNFDKESNNFIYCELAKWNQKAKEEINEAESLKELKKIFNELYKKYFLNYNVKIKEFKEKIINEKEFKELPLNRQKEMFLKMLDLNQMYVQESEMGDKRFGISKTDQKITKKFYRDT